MLCSSHFWSLFIGGRLYLIADLVARVCLRALFNDIELHGVSDGLISIIKLLYKDKTSRVDDSNGSCARVIPIVFLAAMRV